LRQEGKPVTIYFEELIRNARRRTSELKSRLEIKSRETKNSKSHYLKLIRNVTAVNIRLSNLNPALAPDYLDKQLRTIEREIVPLTKQTPYTLLMMRVVEIGLPVLLSLFSIFFVLRYSLTEKRSHEIKDLLKQRNSERPTEEV